MDGWIGGGGIIDQARERSIERPIDPDMIDVVVRDSLFSRRRLLRDHRNWF